MKEEKGVTLIALVITIIIIMILSSIAIYSGASTIRYAKFNKAKSEMQVIQAHVNEWYKEYQEAEDKIQFLDNYGERIDEAIAHNECTQSEIDITFAEGGVTDEIKKGNYKFFSEDFLKEKIGLDASFDYLISIKDRNTILYNGIIYNKEPYYTLDDFGIQNIKQISPYSIEFELEQGENTDIVISNLQLRYGNNKYADISKFIVEYKKNDETDWRDATEKVVKFEDDGETKYKFSVSDYAQYIVKIFTIDKKKEGSNDISLEVRHGIKVGDYIEYTSPTESVSLSTTETGHTSEQTLQSKKTFRVMDIDQKGNMTLIGAMTSSDQSIYFNGALGYNNAVYTLNKKCSDLYKDESKGITARSIKVEDITDKFNQTGMDKLTTYVSNRISSLSAGTNVTKNKNEDDEFDNTVTYSNGNTNYPDIFQYEAGGLIDSTPISGVIGQSDSYSGYNGVTDLASKKATTNLTVPYTYYYTLHETGDFEDSAKSSAYQNMFFEAGTYYWLASRYIRCSSNYAQFGVHIVDNSRLNGGSLFDSSDDPNNSIPSRVCPVVYLPAGVQVEASNNPKNQTNTNGTAHKVK